ncbi:MAG: acyl-CoA synthetase [Actinomycetota bacterium]|nr:acyl-CoA synthetase [Actinomycetota bacterium]
MGEQTRDRGPSREAAALALARRHTVGDLLSKTAARFPERTAIGWRGVRETYAQFNQTVNRTANSLNERGVAKGDRIALLAHNCREFVVLYFALAKLGAISVPLNFMLRAEEVAFILEHSGATGLVVEDALAPVAERALASLRHECGVLGWISLDQQEARPGWEDVKAWMAGSDASEPVAEIADEDPLQLMYTSGTEARPKGVTLTSRSLIAQYVTAIVDGGMSETDVEAHALPFYHCAQLHCFFTPDVYLGATSIILGGAEPGTLLQTIETERITKLFCPPTVWISLLRHPDFDRRDLSSLQKGYYGASAMPVEVLKEISKRLPELRLWNFYGQTEMAPVATILKPHEQLTRLGSAGRAGLNVETMVVDDSDQSVPSGEVGEIVHRSPHAMTGYWQDPERTAQAFKNGWFHSGDLGVIDSDGYLTVVDRKKDMIKTGGENVASREVEEVIFAHPAVAEVAVFGISHPYWVEAVTAAVVLKPGAGVEAEELIAHARTRLAGYKVPRYVVEVDSLPKNPSGKILKRQLRDSHAHLAISPPPARGEAGRGV